MNADQYVSILEKGVVESFEKFKIPEGQHIFQPDNDSKYTNKIILNYFKAQDYDILDWPAQSPDLNPIGHSGFK